LALTPTTSSAKQAANNRRLLATWLLIPLVTIGERLLRSSTSLVEELLGFGMVIAASLVISPFTWYHG
jgi:hypothetical protein